MPVTKVPLQKRARLARISLAVLLLIEGFGEQRKPTFDEIEPRRSRGRKVRVKSETVD